MLTTHPLLVPRLRKSRSYTSCHPNAPLCSVTGPLYFFTFTISQGMRTRGRKRVNFTFNIFSIEGGVVYVQKTVTGLPYSDQRTAPC
jgi:hypothetical protein